MIADCRSLIAASRRASQHRFGFRIAGETGRARSLLRGNVSDNGVWPFLFFALTSAPRCDQQLNHRGFVRRRPPHGARCRPSSRRVHDVGAGIEQQLHGGHDVFAPAAESPACRCRRRSSERDPTDALPSRSARRRRAAARSCRSAALTSAFAPASSSARITSTSRYAAATTSGVPPVNGVDSAHCEPNRRTGLPFVMRRVRVRALREQAPSPERDVAAKRGRMKRGVAGAGRIRIGAGVEQQRARPRYEPRTRP